MKRKLNNQIIYLQNVAKLRGVNIYATESYENKPHKNETTVPCVWCKEHNESDVRAMNLF